MYRIIDANLNRSREGLRVVEDIARFIFNDGKITTEIKNLRNKLAYYSNYYNFRSVETDVGKEISTKTELSRRNIFDVINSNFKRIEESLRVLEEITKLSNKNFSNKFRMMRFEVYILEQKLQKYRKKFDLRLYAIIDTQLCGNRSPEKIARDIISGGATILQLRAKNMGTNNFISLARKLKKISDKIPLIINDRIDICKIVDADGVHLGRDDVGLADARRILGWTKIIGISANKLKTAIAAQRDGADYIGAGPVFWTSTKQDIEKPFGIKGIKQFLNKISIPVVFIGGLNADNLQQCIEAGAKNFAFISAILSNTNTRFATEKLARRIIK